jgi:hypothetical protein
MSRFIAPINESFTRTVPLGPCECPGTPHKDGDTAEVYTLLGWDDLVDIGLTPTEGAAQRVLTTRAIASWTLQYRNGDGTNHPAPINEATVRLLNPATLEAVAEAVNEAYAKAKAPLPNESGEESPRLPPEPDTSIPTTPETAKPTS